MKPRNLKSIANFIYETGILSKTPRSGLWFLGTGNQSVAEHLLRTVYIGYCLAKLTPKADVDRVMFLCLIHDLGEGRVSDLNYAHQKYGRLAERQAIEDIGKSLPFGKEIRDAYTEEQAWQTLEARIAKDADNLEWMATLCEEAAKGNTKGKQWAKGAARRLKTSVAKRLGALLLKTNPDDWWHDESDHWFINRNPKFRRWKGK